MRHPIQHKIYQNICGFQSQKTVAAMQNSRNSTEFQQTHREDWLTLGSRQAWYSLKLTEYFTSTRIYRNSLFPLLFLSIVIWKYFIQVIKRICSYNIVDLKRRNLLVLTYFSLQLCLIQISRNRGSVVVNCNLCFEVSCIADNFTADIIKWNEQNKVNRKLKAGRLLHES